MVICWRCGTDLSELSLPLSRIDECPSCRSQLHVCRMCCYYDPRVTKACREDDAEEVREKDRANFCDYFRPADNAFDARVAAADKEAAANLDALFGAEKSDAESGSGGSEQLPDAEDLFRKD